MKRYQLAVLLFVVCAAARAGLGEPELIRSTIDAGGTIRSSGGPFELSATIGQPDAGSMNGGDFEITGGFWFGLSPPDCDDDGAVTLADLAAFIDCASGPGAGATSNCNCFDTEADGGVDLRDFASIQSNFSGR